MMITVKGLIDLEPIDQERAAAIAKVLETLREKTDKINLAVKL